MTKTSFDSGYDERWHEISEIWKDNRWLYVISGILIGILFTPLIEQIIQDFRTLASNLVPEAVGIIFTILILDRMTANRIREELKYRLVREAGSHSQNAAVSAVDWMRYEEWLTNENGLLAGAYLSGANLEGANLVDSNLQSANLIDVNLKVANLAGANLQSANCVDADLRKAILIGASLKNADLRGANLTNAKLIFDVFDQDFKRTLLKADRKGKLYERITNLALFETGQIEQAAKYASVNSTKATQSLLDKLRQRHAEYYASLSISANIEDAIFDERTILPDGTFWTSETDVRRFTDRNHPDFWKPEE